MKRIRYILLMILPLLFLSSCLTVYEKYTLNRDGSGTMEYLIDMSELQSLMQAFSDSTMEGMKSLEVDQSFREFIPGLRAIQGISNVRLTGDAAHYIYGIKYDFTGQEALNKALATILDEKNESSARFVELKRKRFTRLPLTSSEFSSGGLFGGNDSTDNSMASRMLDAMDYNISVTFPKRVRKVKSDADISREGDRTVTIRATFNQIIQNSDFLKTEIKTR